ncbi:lysophospholipid acyltransferase family protein [Candidatus Palauibacter sp.]|uniref:lysophospholipid acyltransferase family protein n=1 Tax=Candidatus Palauibacter sp. TaxID=3101350 RepID=UPI003AF251F0
MIDRENTMRAGAPPAENGPGALTRLLTPFTRWIITNLLAPPWVFLVFGLLNRTQVYGRRRLLRTPNTLILANHQSMIDSFPIAYYLYYPETVLTPHLVPWNAAAQENFFRSPFLAWVFYQFRCIPVRQGRRDLKALNRSARTLRAGTMILFPEGTRSRDGTIGRGRPGTGMVILQTNPRVIPVTIEGMDRILPIGARCPRIGKRLSIYVGRPIAYQDLAANGRSRETAQKIVDRVMDRLAFQRRVLARLKRARGR